MKITMTIPVNISAAIRSTQRAARVRGVSSAIGSIIAAGLDLGDGA